MTVKCNSKLVTICYPLLNVSTWIWCCLFVAYCLPLPSSTPVQNWERDWLICDGKTELKKDYWTMSCETLPMTSKFLPAVRHVD